MVIDDTSTGGEFIKVVIGLGGRGIEIVDMLARNTLESDKLTTFLAMDTHSEPPSEVGGKLAESVTYISLPTPSDIELKTAGITWCKKTFPKLGGAQRRREYGRVCVTYDRERLKKTIESQIEKAKYLENASMRPILILVASLGGGTGSGANLEILDIIDELKSINPIVLPLLILPNENEGTHLGNAFACLLEWRKVIKSIQKSSVGVLKEGAVILINPNIICDGNWKDVDMQIMAFLDSIIKGRHAELQNLVAGIHADKGFALLIPAVVDIPYEYLDVYGSYIKELFGNVGKHILSKGDIDLSEAGIVGALIKEYKELIKLCENRVGDYNNSGDIINKLGKIHSLRKKITKKPTILDKLRVDVRGNYFLQLYGSDRTKWKQIAQDFDDEINSNLSSTLISPYHETIGKLVKNDNNLFFELDKLNKMEHNTEENLAKIRKAIQGMKNFIGTAEKIKKPDLERDSLLAEVIIMMEDIRKRKVRINDYTKRIHKITSELESISARIKNPINTASIHLTKVFDKIESNPESLENMRRIASIEDFLIDFEGMDEQMARIEVNEKVEGGINRLVHSYKSFYDHVSSSDAGYGFNNGGELSACLMKNVDNDKYSNLENMIDEINRIPFFALTPEMGNNDICRSYYVYLAIGGVDIYHLTGWESMAGQYIQKLKNEKFSPNALHAWGLENNLWNFPGIYEEFKEIGCEHLLDIEIDDFIASNMDELCKNPDRYLPFVSTMLDKTILKLNNLTEDISNIDNIGEISKYVITMKDILSKLEQIISTINKIYATTEDLVVLSAFKDIESSMNRLTVSKDFIAKTIDDVSKMNESGDDIAMLKVVKDLDVMNGRLNEFIDNIQKLKGEMRLRHIV